MCVCGKGGGGGGGKGGAALSMNGQHMCFSLTFTAQAASRAGQLTLTFYRGS